MRFLTSLMALGLLAGASSLAGCAPDFSPNTYDSFAVQQANKVDTGVVIGFREVKISDDGTVGTVTGGAAGGILGATADADPLPHALSTLGGTVVGGLVGNTLQHATGDTTGWEYIVRETKGDLVSVTQREPMPLPIGQKVLVIEGKQARIVPDYASASAEQPSASPASKGTADTIQPAEASPQPGGAVPAPAPAIATTAPPAAPPPSAPPRNETTPWMAPTAAPADMPVDASPPSSATPPANTPPAAAPSDGGTSAPSPAASPPP